MRLGVTWFIKNINRIFPVDARAIAVLDVGIARITMTTARIHHAGEFSEASIVTFRGAVKSALSAGAMRQCFLCWFHRVAKHPTPTNECDVVSSKRTARRHRLTPLPSWFLS